jgi:hypothetical protein
MPRIIFSVSEEEKALWVEAAYREFVSLSEWLRRAAAARAQGRVELTGVALTSNQPIEPSPAPSPPRSPRARGARTQMCEHRVPAGSFCKTCDT